MLTRRWSELLSAIGVQCLLGHIWQGASNIYPFFGTEWSNGIVDAQLIVTHLIIEKSLRLTLRMLFYSYFARL